jgi:hypothetical protein
MEPIGLIQDTAYLDGTAYFEFQPGRFKGDFWLAGSAFLPEEVFCYLEPTIRRHHPGFDHYAHVTIGSAAWNRIVQDLEGLTPVIRKAASVADLRRVGVGFHRPGVDVEFEDQFSSNADALATLIEELACWLREQLRTHTVISVLGM